MGWWYLLLAGLCEIGWPIGLKLGWTQAGLRFGWLAFAIACIIASGGLLLLALREIPVGTAYAVWTGIGAIGAFLVGITLFGDANTALRWASVALITAGIIGLKLA
jgi:quaternary ammonium compound-resistance protein SugE